MLKIILLSFFLLNSFVTHSAQAMTCSSFLEKNLNSDKAASTAPTPEPASQKNGWVDYQTLIKAALPSKTQGGLRAADFQKALDLALEYKGKSSPMSHQPYVFLAEIYFRKAHHIRKETYSKALEAYETILQLSPPEATKVKASAFRKKIFIYIRRAEYRLAEGELTQLLDIAPKNPKTFYTQALLQKGLRLTDEALESIDQALSKVKPNDRILRRESFLLKVEILLQDQRNQDAIDAIAEAAEAMGYLPPHLKKFQSIALKRIKKAARAETPDWIQERRDDDFEDDWRHDGRGLNDNKPW